MGVTPPQQPPALHEAWAHAGSPVDQIAIIRTIWATGEMSAGTQRRFGDLATRFASRLTATGVASLAAATVEDCEAFVWTRTRRNQTPSMHTVHLRRSALRAAFAVAEQLDPRIVDPTRRLDLPAKTAGAARPLSDAEVDLLRITALGRQRTPMRTAAMVALAETTATTTEIAQARWRDVDLDRRIVHLTGADPVRPRAGQLTDWGAATLNAWERQRQPSPDQHVLDRRRPDSDPHVAQAAITNKLRLLLSDAGLRDPRIRPTSVRLWAGRRALDHGGIEAAARALGLASLDTTAAALGHLWQDPS